MPGDQRARIDKGAALGRDGIAGNPADARIGLDAVIMDLEDGVALTHKAAARAVTLAALRENDFGSAERIVRINPADSAYWLDDLTGTIDGQPDAYLIAKVEAADQVAAVAAWLTEAETARDWPVGAIALLAQVETARGIAFVREIAAAAPGRLAALGFGAEDLAGSMGSLRQPDLREAAYARSALVLHAKAFGLQAIDTPFLRWDAEAIPALTAETRSALELGYDGKFAIHPAQIAPITATFYPNAAELAAARALIAAYDEQQAAGLGAFAYHGTMIDLPAIRHARALISRAR